MLNKDFILNEWIPALRSGKYNQGRHSLRTRRASYVDFLNNDKEPTPVPVPSYCCLGVACDILMKKGLLHKWHYSGTGHYSVPGTSYKKDALAEMFPSSSEDEDNQVAHVLPRRVAEYIGISENGSDVLVSAIHNGSLCQFHSLVIANDCEVDFETIANALEEFVHKDELE